MIHDLYLRSHVVLPDTRKKREQRSAKRQPTPKLWPDLALVFDTETELGLLQPLNFGVWRMCELRRAEYVPIQEGIFYRDKLGPKQIRLIQQYRERDPADELAEGSHSELEILSRAEFVERVFWESVRAGALIVGFNLPFDISRLAVDWKVAQNGGFSFILSELNKKRVENRHRPRIRISPLNGVAEKIELTAVRQRNEQHQWRRGRFLDLHTLAFALIDTSYSLAGVAGEFAPQTKKMEYEPTGRVSDEEITYARQDVRVTVAVLNGLKREYDLHPITLAPDKAYSPASIGKAYLRAMGIAKPMEKFGGIVPYVQGVAMASYFGGRAECRIRRWPVPVVPVDLTSEYPTVDALLGTGDVLTARQLTIEDMTENVRALLADVSLNGLFERAFWKKLNFYAQIVPDGDILPVRSVYNDNSGTCNIGLNELRWKQPMW